MIKMYSSRRFNEVRIILLFIFSSVLVHFGYAGKLNSANKQKPVEIEHTRSANKTSVGGMLFTPNKGQIVDIDGHLRPDILFKGHSNGAAVYLRKSGISYVRSNAGELMHEIDEQLEEKTKQFGLGRMEADELRQELMHKASVKLNRLDIDFEEANTSNVEIETDGQTEGYTNYYYAHCPQGITNVFSYNTVIRKNIYDGIDVKYYGSTTLTTGGSTSCLPAGKALSTSGGKEHGLKYDIVVNPGADPGQIKLKYSGYNSIRINNGKLVVGTDLGTIEESLPRVYQLINGQVIDVSCGYVLTAKNENGNKRSGDAIVSFKLETLPDGQPAWNRDYPLIIDPFIWATYYGGADSEYSTDIAVDASGNTYVTGGAANLFPIGAAPGNSVFQAFYVLSTDAIVVKFTPNGSRLWATYYGGAGSTSANSIATDLSGNVVITGTTSSTNFPVGAVAGNTVFQSAYGGTASSNAFVVKFTSIGTRLWATYYGGTTLTNAGYGITTDYLGNIAITGYTTSTTFPIGATAGNTTFQAAYGGSDIFVVKFDPTGARLWSTFYGNNGNVDYGYAIAADLAGNLAITGYTYTNNATASFPIGFTTGNVVVQAASGGGVGFNFVDAFVVKFDPTGIRLWATFYGGGADEHGNDVTIDKQGNVIITGYSGNGPGTFPVGAAAGNTVFQSVYGGGLHDAFVVKFAPNGARLWATYHGGNQDDWAVSCSVDDNGNIYILGEWEDVDNGNFPMNTCALQKTNGGVAVPGDQIEDWFVTKFRSTGQRICSTFIGGTGHDELEDTYGGIATFQNYVYLTGVMAGGYPSGSNAGQFPVTAGAWQTVFGGRADIVVAKFCGNSCGDNNSITSDFNVPSGLCNNTAIQFTPTVIAALNCDTTSYLYKWYFPGANIYSSTLKNPSGILYPSGTYTVSLVVDGVCVRDSISKVITVNNCGGCQLAAQMGVKTNVTPCNGGNNGTAQVTISNGGGGPYTYNWSNGNSGTTTASTISATNLTAGIYTITITEGTCKSTVALTITEPQPLLILLTDPQWSCQPSATSVTASVSNGNAPYIYSWSNNQTISTATGLSAGNYTLLVTDQNNCTSSQSLQLIAPPALTTSITSTNISCTLSGSASITPTGGVPPFSFTWSNGQTLSTVSGTSTISCPTAGVYTVTIADGIGCTAIQTYTITGSSLASAVFTAPSPICIGQQSCFTNTGTVGTYNWTISPDNVSGTTTNFCYTFLSAGTYSVSHTVTTAGCVNTVNKVITVTNCSAGPAITATGSSVCSGICGTVTSSGTGGSVPYTYSWSNGAATQNINPCPVSTTTYTVTIMDAGGNASTSTAIVTINPAVTASAIATNITCNGGTGSASASGGNGTLPYTFNWSNGGASFQISNLTSQIYTVTVTDSKGCTAISTAAIVSPPALTGQFTKGTATCGGCGCKEWIMINAAGGTSPYSYTWPDGYLNRYKNQLCPGAYMVNIKDKNGCSVSVNLTAP